MFYFKNSLLLTKPDPKYSKSTNIVKYLDYLKQ